MAWKNVQYQNGKLRTNEGGGGGGSSPIIIGNTAPASSVGENGNIYCQVDNNVTGVKISIYRNRNNVSVTQLSEIRFNDGSNNYFNFTGASISSNKTGASSSESVEKLIDSNVDTKFCVNSFTPTFENPLEIYLTFALEFDIAAYPIFEYWTANDEPERDPISFDIDITLDGDRWINLVQARNETITQTRKVKGYEQNISGTFFLKQWYKSNGNWARLYS